jgi:GNAT superfamily N-acetyltransferase
MINIRDFNEQDKSSFINMCTSFFSTGATLHPLSSAAIANTFNEIMAKNPFLRGLIIENDFMTSGYINLSFTYSNEANGFVVLIEELYILPEFQGKGLGSYALKWIFNEYNGKAKRYRLEVCSSNQGAIRLYKSLGFEKLDYNQMIIDVNE